MDEQIIITSKPAPFRKSFFISVIAIILAVFIIPFLVHLIRYESCDKLMTYWDGGLSKVAVKCGDAPHSEWHDYDDSRYDGFNYAKCSRHCYYETGADFAMAKSKKILPITGGISAGVILLSILLFTWLHNSELTVTDKRVYGHAAFGKRVDLPMDSISAFGSSWPKGISVASSSGRISFLMLQNRDEIYECVSNLMLERQTKAPVVVTEAAPSAPSASTADELKKYKELLDMGVITQEEFDAKKKQLLGL